MPQKPGVPELLADLANALSGCYDWFLFGAQAVQVWGIPRLSADVDVTVRLGSLTVQELVSTLQRAGFVLRVSDDDDFVARTRVLPFVHRPSRIPVDVVLAGPGPEDEFLARARPIEVAGVTVPVISPEDLIVTKILAGRPKDLEDVRGILRSRGSHLDLGRVREVLALLEEALGQSDLVPLLDAQLETRRSGPS
jgi:hypothetical protein